MATATKPKKKAKNSARGRLRADAPRDFWHGPKHKLNLGLQEFRVSVLRPHLPTLHLDDLVESISWTEPADSAIVTGEIRYREPAYATHGVNIVPGDRVRVDYSEWGQKQWKELWTLRSGEPTASLRDGARSVALANDLLIFSRSIDDFNYGKSKTRPRGWRISQAVRHLCKRFGLRIGRLAVMNHRVKKKSWIATSPLRVLNDLMVMQRNYTGRRYVIRFIKGKLNILPLQRSKDLMILGPTLIDAAMQQSLREDFATVLTVRATVEVRAGTGSGNVKNKRVTNRKINVTVRSKAGVKRYGYIHRIVYAHGAESVAEARKMGKRHLAKIVRPNRELTLNHVGIPTLHKGDAIRIALPELGLKQIVYVSEITQTVTAGSYTMDVTVTFDDPYVDKKQERVDENKDTVIRKTEKKKAKPKTPAKNENRRDQIPAPPKESKGDKLKRASER